jgi:hypothetical protein
MDEGGPVSGERRRGVQRFDPLQSFTDAHRLAIDTADASFQFFARFLDDDGADHHHNGSSHEPTDGLDQSVDGDGLAFGELRRAITRSLDLYLELAERLFDSSTRSLESALRMRGVTVTPAPRHPKWTPLQLDAVPGDHTTGLMWLHNQTDVALSAVTFRPTDLSAHDGSVIRASTIDVAPRTIDRLPPDASVSATVTIDVAGNVRAGLYVGHVLVSPEADAVLPLHLRVVRREPLD